MHRHPAADADSDRPDFGFLPIGCIAPDSDPPLDRAGFDVKFGQRRNHPVLERVDKSADLCVAPFHYRHMDELLADMGAAKRSSANPLTEYLSYPRAGKFRAYLDSAPQYVAG